MAGGLVRRRRRRSKPPHDPGWTMFAEWRVNGRILTRGTEAKISGESGRFVFQRAVVNAEGAVWLDFVGGPRGTRMARSFFPERVRTVHRLKKSEKALVEERKGAAA